jgi:hypothetical protein
MRIDKISQVIAGIFLATALPAAFAHAQATLRQQQTESLGDAARKAREQNKARPTGKVITNEDIPNIKGTVSVVGTPAPEPVATQPNPAAAPPGTPAPGAEGATPAGTDKSATAGSKPEVKDETYWRKQFADARRKLADDSKELDVLQREYNLKQQQFYLDPNVALREQYGRADLNKTLDQINAKKTDVEKDQQAISSLEDQLRQAGGNPGWAREPNPPAIPN